jgi:hypothetical protein
MAGSNGAGEVLATGGIGGLVQDERDGTAGGVRRSVIAGEHHVCCVQLPDLVLSSCQIGLTLVFT